MTLPYNTNISKRFRNDEVSAYFRAQKRFKVLKVPETFRKRSTFQRCGHFYLFIKYRPNRAFWPGLVKMKKKLQKYNITKVQSTNNQLGEAKPPSAEVAALDREEIFLRIF